MRTDEWIALLLLCTATSFTPGPNTTLSTALAANLGLRRALPFVLAVPLGWALLLAACALGLGPLIVRWPLLAGLLRAAGALYLLYLAVQLLRARSLGAARAQRLHIGFAQGVALQAVNIKAWMLALAVTSGWLVGRPDALLRAAQLLPVLLGFALASNLTYASLGHWLRPWLADASHGGRRLRVFNALMAALLAGTALWIAWAA